MIFSVKGGGIRLVQTNHRAAFSVGHSPLCIAVPIIANKIWNGAPLTQFFSAYQFRVTMKSYYFITQSSPFDIGFG